MGRFGVASSLHKDTLRSPTKASLASYTGLCYKIQSREANTDNKELHLRKIRGFQTLSTCLDSEKTRLSMLDWERNLLGGHGSFCSVSDLDSILDLCCCRLKN